MRNWIASSKEFQRRKEETAADGHPGIFQIYAIGRMSTHLNFCICWRMMHIGIQHFMMMQLFHFIRNNNYEFYLPLYYQLYLNYGISININVAEDILIHIIILRHCERYPDFLISWKTYSKALIIIEDM